MNFKNKFFTIKMIHEINSLEAFDKLLSKYQYVLVDFYATWCGPCKMIAPHIHNLSEQLGNYVAVAKIDVDELEDLPIRIKAMPTFAFFVNKKHVDEVVGGNLPEIKRLIKVHFKVEL